MEESKSVFPTEREEIFRGECVPLWKMEGYVCFDFYIFDGVCNRTLHPDLVSYESGEEVAERFMILLKTVKI